MGTRASTYFAYATLLILVGSLFSLVVPAERTFASHSDIEFEIDDTVFGTTDDVTITGTVDGGDENDSVGITVEEAGGGDETDSVDLNDDGEFDYNYEVPSNGDDGIYQVIVEFDNEEVFGFFIVDEEDDELDVSTDLDTYDLGDDVTIEGTVLEEILDSSVEEVEITILGPDGTDVLDSEDVEIDNDGDFEYDDFSIDDSDDAHGLYAVIVEYDGQEAGWAVFEVEEDSGSGGSSQIIASITDPTLNPGDEVEIVGSIDEDDVEVGEEVFLVVEDPDGDELDITNDSVDPDNDGGFDFNFDLEDDAETGTYDVTLSYGDYDDKVLTFTVSTTSSGGSGGSGGSSGSDGGLTAKLNKASFLAGETLTVSGVVPSIAGDEDGVSITVSTPGNNFIAAKFPEPESSKAYSASFFLPQSLEEDDDYRVVVSYDGNEVPLTFDITGKTTGSTGGPISVKTDKGSYSAGSTVIISGEISDDIFIEGQPIALQVYNPQNAAYRIDQIQPEDDGSYSYSMPVGGPLGVTGEWEVKVTYNKQVAESTFDLTGGVSGPPTYQLKFEDQTFPIKYTPDGAINSMFLRPLEKKLIVMIDGESDGTLTLTLPRVVIDAVQGGSDTKFIVTTLNTQTGEEAQIDITESVTNAQERTIVIDYDAGTGQIEIQGTNVVPEFGFLSAIVLAIAVGSVLVLAARFNKFGIFRQW